MTGRLRKVIIKDMNLIRCIEIGYQWPGEQCREIDRW